MANVHVLKAGFQSVAHDAAIARKTRGDNFTCPKVMFSPVSACLSVCLSVCLLFLFDVQLRNKYDDDDVNRIICERIGWI